MTAEVDPWILQEQALGLNHAGWRVFPVRFEVAEDMSVSKRPCIRGYHGDVPFTEREIRRFPWAGAEALGWALPPDVVVLDVDVKDGSAGDQHLVQLEGIHGRLPRTATQRTRSGGMHLVFRLATRPVRLQGRVPLNSGDRNFADIDVCHSRLRYMTIYSIAVFDQDFAVLPDRWCELITKPAIAKHMAGRPTGLSGTVESSDPWERLSKVREGDHRNNELNRTVFLIARAGQWGEDQEYRATELARNSGLGQDSIKATIASAVSAGEGERDEAEQWYRALIGDDRIANKRNRHALRQTAAQLRELAVVHGMRVGLSGRELAERLGVSHKTAAQYLVVLRALGHLERDSPRGDRRKALRFKLVTPDCCTKGDSPPAPCAPTPAGGLSPLDHLAPPMLYRHDAFVRPTNKVWLPKSCAGILARLVVGPCTVGELATATGLSRATVRSGAHKLESAGLVVYHSRGSREIERCFSDLTAALDRWAEFSGSAGAVDRLRARFVLERELRDRPRTGRQLRAQRAVVSRASRRGPRSPRLEDAGGGPAEHPIGVAWLAGEPARDPVPFDLDQRTDEGTRYDPRSPARSSGRGHPTHHAWLYSPAGSAVHHEP